MKRTNEEMADHIREAIRNANAVMKEAVEEGYEIDLLLDYCFEPRLIVVESISITKSL